MFHRIALFTTFLTLFVVVLGAYVRLSDAGLGCPDWPGCYGQMVVPDHTQDAQEIDKPKAWKEMIHRYVAGTLGILVLSLAVMAWVKKRQGFPVVLPSILVILVTFQALLGMWTVTILLNPVIVMGHLLGGLTILACLTWLTLRTQARKWETPNLDILQFRGIATSALLLVFAQIALGGWTSANYAALVCPDFPQCQAQDNGWPETDFAGAFSIPYEAGMNYEGGVLGETQRVTIHMTHRLGAILVLIVVGFLALRLMLKSYALRHIGAVLLLLLLLQVGLGIANVIYTLPLSIAIAHNGVAACLLVALVWLNHRVRPIRNGD